MRDNWDDFRDKGVALLGVNPGSSKSHRKFKARHQFPFPLLVDEGKEVASQYGAGGLFVRRSVYGVNMDGRICFAERGSPAPRVILAAVGPASANG